MRTREGRTGDAAERRAAADEAEQPLRLPRVVDDVGERPELADQQDARGQSGDVERHRDPVASVWNRNQNRRSRPP